MITYNELYDALRKERYSEQLQPIPKNFIKDFSLYLKDKKEITQNKSPEELDENDMKIKKQFENSLAIFKELMLRRKKKILELGFVATETGISKRDFDNMLIIEKECFDGIMKSLEKEDKKIAEMLKGVDNEEKKTKNKMVVFIEDAAEFLDMEGNKLGPFKKGDFANIPEEIANILIVDKIVEPIDEE